MTAEIVPAARYWRRRHGRATGDDGSWPIEHGFWNGKVREREGATMVLPRGTSEAEEEQDGRGAR